MSGLRVLVLGANGMLGHKLAQRLPEFDLEVWGGVRGPGKSFASFGILPEARILGGLEATSPENIRRAIKEVSPDAVINAIGVVKQKEEARFAAQTIEINSVFPHRLYEACQDAGARLVHISTDCVFSGIRGRYAESDPADAQDLYGRSKALGEVESKGAVTIRTSIIGRELGSSHGLLEWFLSRKGGTVGGYVNAYFSGFTTEALTELIARFVLARPELQGIYHAASERISKYRLLTLINKEMDLGIEIEPDEGLVIDRSLDAGRFCELTGYDPPNWEQMVRGLAEDDSPYEEWRKAIY